MNTDDLSYNLSMIFERTAHWKFDQVTITPRMIEILSLINGERSLAAVYEKLQITYESLFSEVQKLHGLRLIKIADRSAPLPPLKKTATAGIKQGCYRGAVFEMPAVE